MTTSTDVDVSSGNWVLIVIAVFFGIAVIYIDILPRVIQWWIDKK
jgi:uncharacterized membrane protein